MVEDGVQCLQECSVVLKSQSLLQPITLSFKGLGNFNDKAQASLSQKIDQMWIQVLFLEVEEGRGLTALHSLAESLAEHFVTQGVLSDVPREMKAHLTIAKTSNLFNKRRSRSQVCLAPYANLVQKLTPGQKCSNSSSKLCSLSRRGGGGRVCRG